MFASSAAGRVSGASKIAQVGSSASVAGAAPAFLREWRRNLVLAYAESNLRYSAGCLPGGKLTSEDSSSETAERRSGVYQGPPPEAQALAGHGFLSRWRKVRPRVHRSQESRRFCRPAETLARGQVHQSGISELVPAPRTPSR